MEAEIEWPKGEEWVEEETILGKCARPRPRLVCRNGKVVGDAVVIVSPRDPNWYRNHLADGFDGEITVKPPFVRRI